MSKNKKINLDDAEDVELFEKLSVDELIKEGKLPPPKERITDKEPVTGTDVSEVSEEIQRAWDRHSKRGQMAMEFLKSILKETGIDEKASVVSDYAFKLADYVQQEIDDGYQADAARAQARASGLTIKGEE